MGSLGDKLNYLLDTKSAIKNALMEKGVSVLDSDTFRSYADKISSISSGSGSGSTAYIERVLNNGKLEMPSGSIELSSDVKDLGQSALCSAYVYSAVESVSFPALATISGDDALSSAFSNCSALTSVSFPALATISGADALSYAFSNCSALTSVSFPALTTIAGVYALSYAFSNCSASTSVSFPALTTIAGVYALSHAFSNCSALTSVSFPALTTIASFNALQQTFENCVSLTSVSFPALPSTFYGSDTDLFDSMLSGVTGCTVHFPSNLEDVIGSWSDVTSGFGGINTIVLFDLPSTSHGFEGGKDPDFDFNS